MPRRYLFGPVTRAFAEENLSGPTASGQCLAADGNLLWHWYRHCLPRCDLVLTDVAGVEAMRAEGMEHGRAANLFGLGEALAERAENAEKDIDILFVGNLHPAVQGERLGWLGRLARL